MAFKDRFEKLISYFDTDDVNELEELAADLPQVTGADEAPAPKAASSRPARSTEQDRVVAQPIAPKPQVAQTPPSRPVAKPAQESVARPATAPRERVPQRASQPTQQLVNTSQGQTTIALKYPRRYEDAPAIVDLLINNECVLIDFEYMLDAQARRCLDFLDGASRVLYGSLQKVGANMYLLAPANVVVDIEEILAPLPQTQESSYNYDMKRR